MTLQQKQLICRLINQAIGDRTLDIASEDTGLSRNRLHRLKTGGFQRIPDDYVIKAITDDSSYPQNGVTYQDFVNIIAGNNKVSENSFEYTKSVKILNCIVIDWLMSKKQEVKISGDSKHFDLIAEIGDLRFFFEYKIVNSQSVNRTYFDRLQIQLMGSIATSSLKKNDTAVIVTNSKKLADLLIHADNNISSNIILLLVELDSLEIIREYKLN